MLKQFITLLLSRFYSKQESALVANQAMPISSTALLPSSDPNVLNISLDKTETTDWSRLAYYTAPTSGHLQFEGKAIAEGSYIQCGAIWAQEHPAMKIRGFLPVAKGNTVSISANRVKEVKAIFIKSIGSVGGGY